MMEKALNVPYRKKFDKNGILKNPIIGGYISEFDNRKIRREKLQKSKFYGESKNYHLTIVETSKYQRRKQYIFQKDGTIKTILHYI